MLRGKAILGLRYKRWLKPEHWQRYKLGLILAGIEGILIGIALVILLPISMSLMTGERSWGLYFTHWLIVLAAIAVIVAAIDYISVRQCYIAGLGFMRHMLLKLGHKIANWPLGAFKADTAGEMSRIVSKEMVDLMESMAHFNKNFLTGVGSSLIVIVGCWAWNRSFGLLVTIAVPTYALIIYIASHCVDRGQKMSEPAEQNLASRIVEFAKYQGALRSAHVGTDYKVLNEAFAASQKYGLKNLIWGSLGNILSGMAAQIIVVSLIVLAGVLAVTGQLMVLQTIVIIGMSLRFITMLEDVSNNLFGIVERGQMLGRLDEILDTDELPEVKSSAPITSPGEIVIENVVFAYNPGQPVIQNVNFVVSQGEMCAIVGPSGCGKTTIMKLIARFYDIDSGSVSVGGQDVRDLTTEKLMEQISKVFQDVYLFDDTLEANVLIGRPDATRAELERVAELAGVSEIVRRLPDGWKTRCGEGGRSLSGGERQRVSIARALLKRAPIVLFDEATSALDAENEVNIVKSMKELKQHSTLLVIAHKLETIQAADKIVVLAENGTVAQIGNHQKLVQDPGPYHGFWMQRYQNAGWKLV